MTGFVLQGHIHWVAVCTRICFSAGENTALGAIHSEFIFASFSI